MNNLIQEVNNELERIIDDYHPSKVQEAMKYSLMNGGKRLRPLIFINVLSAYEVDYHPYLDVACAIEMIHTYSLIHDDLPAMDNDNLRRGKPTCHKQYGEAIALLAGDGLLNEAVNVIIKTNIKDSIKVNLIKVLYEAAGIEGMIYGQELDILSENKQLSKDDLIEIHRNKTGALIAACFKMASIICDESNVDNWQDFGYKLGLAFQIQDDILDVTSTSEELGKNPSDEENHKSTYVSLLTLEGANKEVERLFKELYSDFYGFQINHGVIMKIIEEIKNRKN